MDRMKVIASYYPKQGQEKAILNLIENKVIKLAKKLGVLETGICYNKGENSYMAYGDWVSEEAANRFILHQELKETTLEINELSRKPTERGMFNIIKDKAA